jgi:ParB family chromosome partitioning protein
VSRRDDNYQQRAVSAIRVGARRRQDLGDIEDLAGSIRDHGLLQPVTVTADNTLICGARRLAAVKLLGAKTITVLVRPDESGRLAALLGEREDDRLHKKLTPLEAASLYEEVKAEIAADNAQRQTATRFGSAARNGAADGGVSLTPPRQARNDSRVQAAELTGGAYSYGTLERVSWLKRAAQDPSMPNAVRAAAAQALASVEAGGAVEPAYLAVRVAAAVSRLAQVAEDPASPEETRREAEREAAALREQAARGATVALDKAASRALERVTRGRRPEPPRGRPGRGGAARFDPRGSMRVWRDMPSLVLGHDPAEVAATLTQNQWELICDVVGQLASFHAQVAQARAALT